MNKRTTGVVLSYLLIVIDIVVGIVFVPFLLGGLGEDEYGLYKLLFSTASYLSVLDFGIGATITRYIVKFKTEGRKQDEENFAAMGLIIYAALSVIVIVLAIGISFFIPTMYASSISADKMGYARILFLLMCTNTAVNLFNHAYNGLLHAYESFFFTKTTNIAKVLLRVGLIVAGVTMKPYAVIVVGVDLFLSVAILIMNIVYTRFRLKCRIKLHKWDKLLAKEALIFTTAILAQSIINQFNSNVDNVVLGIFTTTSVITMYSIALQLFTMYSSLSTAVSTIYLPTISKAVFRGESDDKITERIIAPSRIQLMILLLALSGFFLFGKDFIGLWVGSEYNEAYLIAGVLLSASTVELSQNTMTSVLKAKNMLHGKTLILGISTAINAIITVVLVPIVGAWGAAIGTAFSMVFGYGVALNIYYQKRAKINMKMYYLQTYKGIIIAIPFAVAIGWLISYFMECNSYFDFILEAGLYAIAYGVLMLLIGMNKNEKGKLFGVVKKIMGKIKRKSSKTR